MSSPVYKSNDSEQEFLNNHLYSHHSKIQKSVNVKTNQNPIHETLVKPLSTDKISFDKKGSFPQGSHKKKMKSFVKYNIYNDKLDLEDKLDFTKSRSNQNIFWTAE